MASLATFVIGAYAVHYLEPDTLGAYGLFFSAFVLAAIIPTQLVLVPAEVALLAYDPVRQIATARSTLLLATPLAALSGVAGALTVTLLARGVPNRDLVALGLTSVAASVLSPCQDHVRRLLHQAGASRVASMTSMVQLTVVVLSILVMSQLGVPYAWVPFGALVLANLISITVGMVTSVRLLGVGTRVDLPKRGLISRGRWLVLSAATERAAGFAVLAVITLVAGATVTGYVEATRVLSQPVIVLGIGLMSVMRPEVMEAASDGDQERARSISARYLAALALAGSGLILIIGFDWYLNPLVTLFETAYAEPGLLAAAIVGSTLASSTLIFRNELIGAGEEKKLAGLMTLAALAMVGVCLATVSAIGAFASPLAVVTRSVVINLGQLRVLSSYYADRAARTHES